jgi:hypothetical protein
MITLRPSEERGVGSHGWLESRHTFSFADYHDRNHMHFRSLRVINEDWIDPGQGFGTHPHRDMEIVTCVLEGALQHRDSLGNGSIIRPGEMQRMTAGTGVAHSEFNASETERVHLCQIWLLPERKGLEPGYEQKEFPESERRNRLRLVAARDARDGSLTIHQDAEIHLAALDDGIKVTHALETGRGAWIQVLRGAIDLNGQSMSEGDGAAVENETALMIHSRGASEVMVFDLA